MKNNRKTTGFTMIELIVVIIIISMLATISVAVFQNHLKKGRDSFRKVGIDSVSMIVRLDRVSQEKSNYDLAKIQVANILSEKSIRIPKAEAGHEYFYGYSSKKEDFFVVVCGEKKIEFFVSGTPAGTMAVLSTDPENVCDGSSVPIKDRPTALDSNAPATNLDAYIIYKLS